MANKTRRNRNKRATEGEPGVRSVKSAAAMKAVSMRKRREAIKKHHDRVIEYMSQATDALEEGEYKTANQLLHSAAQFAALANGEALKES